MVDSGKSELTNADGIARSTPPPLIELPLLDVDENHPRRLLRLPTGQILAFGGDDCAICLLPANKVVRKFEGDPEGIRAVACSSDGKRVAVGFADGSTKLFYYPEIDCVSVQDHPFCATAATDEADSLLSQTAREDRPGEVCRAGPQSDSPVRDMQFLPSTHYLAIATESGFSIIDVGENYNDNAGDNAAFTTYLQKEAEDAHDNSGIRAISLHQIPATKKTDSANATMIVASIDLDGRLCLWDVSAKKPSQWKLLKREAGRCITRKDVTEILGSDSWDRSCRPAFVQSGLLALPGETYLQLRQLSLNKDAFTIEIADCDQILSGKEKQGRIQGHVESIVSFAVSPSENDPYMITAGRDGRVILWEIRNNDPADSSSVEVLFVRQLADFDPAPTDILWDHDHNDEERLYVVCSSAKVAIFEGRNSFAPSQKKQPTKSNNAKSSSKQINELHSVKNRKQLANAPPETDDFADSDEEFDSENASDAEVTEIGSTPSAATVRRNNVLVDDQAQEATGFDDDDSAAASLPKNGTHSGSAKGTSSAKQDDVPDSLGNDYDGYEDADADDRSNASGIPLVRYHSEDLGHTLPRFELPLPQPAFAPSSTPLDEPRRFMCWNHIGSVTRIDGGEGPMTQSSIHIDFTDAAFRRPITFTDDVYFTLGSLGDDGAIFATDLTEDTDDDNDDADPQDLTNGLPFSEATRAALKRQRKRRVSRDGNKPTGSIIYFHRFETFGKHTEKDWYLTLPNDERALGCACGEGWAAVITSRRFLRLFSSGGNQGQVVWLNGDPVTIVGRSRFLAVFYHESMPLLDQTQKLGYLLFDAVANCVVTKGSVSCISKASSLSWVGFSDEQSLLAMDSDGMLSMLVCSCPADSSSSAIASFWEWMPVLDTVGLCKSADDSYWPITVIGGKMMCVPLKGGTKYPDATRRPVTAALGLRLPLARGTLPKSNALEEVMIRADVALNQKKVIQSIISTEVDAGFEKEYRSMSAQVDKVTLKFFHAAVEAGKLEQSLDLVGRLHLEKSFDLAMVIADNHRKLVDLIEDAKNQKFGLSQDLDDNNCPPYGTNFLHQKITPDIHARGKRSMDQAPLAESRNVRRRGP